MAEMYVKAVAYTQIDYGALRDAGYVTHSDRLADSEPDYLDDNYSHEAWDEWDDEAYPSPIDELHEFGGRNCYKSWNRPNPETQTNKDYLRKSIIDSQHYSVLAHGHVSLYVSGVSRALLLELERHQKKSHLNFSVVSQRYVNHGTESDAEVVAPPLFDEEQANVLRDRFKDAQADYDRAVEELMAKGHTRKEARGAARAFLPENTETSFLVTASIRGWRDVLEQRLPKAADAEIRLFAIEVLKELVRIAPNSVQDFAEEYLTEESK